MDLRSPPTRFSDPNGSSDGPVSTCFSDGRSPTATCSSAPRGNDGWAAAAGQNQPPPSASSDVEADLLEFLEVAITCLGHRPSQAADQVQRAERVVRRAGEHLLQRRSLTDRHLQ